MLSELVIDIITIESSIVTITTTERFRSGLRSVKSQVQIPAVPLGRRVIIFSNLFTRIYSGQLSMSSLWVDKIGPTSARVNVLQTAAGYMDHPGTYAAYSGEFG